MQGIFAECSLRKQAWRNPIKEGRVGCLHQNIFTRKVTDIAFTSDFFNNHYCPRVPVPHVPASHTSPRPILDVPKSLVSRPQVPAHTSHVPVPLSPSHFYTQPVSKQGVKKIIFTACHSGKLKLAVTSPDVISTSPKNFLTSSDFTVLVIRIPQKTSLAHRAS